MARTQVPEEQQRVSDLSELKNKLAPTDERVVFVESAALSEPNFYWWDSSGDASTADGVKSVASNMSGFQDGDPDEGLWRRFDISFESATTDDLAEGSTNLYFSNERVDDRVADLIVGGTNITTTYDDVNNTLTIDGISAGGTPNLQSISTDTTTSGDRYYSVDTSASEVTVTLASADAINGKEISVKRRGKNRVFIDTEGSQTIDGSNQIRIKQDKNAVKLVFNSNNSEWEIY